VLVDTVFNLNVDARKESLSIRELEIKRYVVDDELEVCFVHCVVVWGKKKKRG